MKRRSFYGSLRAFQKRKCAFSAMALKTCHFSRLQRALKIPMNSASVQLHGRSEILRAAKLAFERLQPFTALRARSFSDRRFNRLLARLGKEKAVAPTNARSKTHEFGFSAVMIARKFFEPQNWHLNVRSLSRRCGLVHFLTGVSIASSRGLARKKQSLPLGLQKNHAACRYDTRKRHKWPP